MPTLTTAISGGSRAGSWFRRACLFLALPVLGLALGCSKIASSDATAPTITSFTPVFGTGGTGATGTLVTVYGSGFTGATAVTVCGVTVPSNDANNDYPNNIIQSDSEITFNLPLVYISGPITVTGAGGGTVTSGSVFEVPPTFTIFTPTSGTVGSPVSIAGNGLLGVTGVTFNGTAAAIDTATATYHQITVTVPTGLTPLESYNITLNNSYGLPSVTSSATYTVGNGTPGAPLITSFTQSGTALLSTITIQGSGLTGASVTIGTAPAIPMTNVTVVSDSEVTCNLPATAVTGVLTVTTPVSHVATATFCIVVPNIVLLNPSAGSTSGNTPITITGTGLDGVQSIAFGSTPAPMTSQTANQIVVPVPAGLPTGPITITYTMKYGQSDDYSPFTVNP
jgi:hypothetical protein